MCPSETNRIGRLISLSTAVAALAAAVVLTSPAAAVITPTGEVQPLHDGSDPWNTGALLRVGVNAAGQLIVDGGSDLISHAGLLGVNALGQGTVEINGVGSTWSAVGGLRVANLGQGILRVQTGGVVTNVGHGFIGFHAGSTGQAFVSGTSLWNNTGGLWVGSDGFGALTISAGGSVSSQFALIAAGASSQGTVTVTGVNSEWINHGALRVGNMGDGALVISAGGRLTNAGIGFIGMFAGADGIVTISGAGSQWINESSLRVGNFGDGRLTVNAGGQISIDGHALIAAHAGAEGHVTVDGAGSTWDNDGFLWIGNLGDATLEVTGGATVSTGVGLIAFGSGSRGEVTVAGHDGIGNFSTWFVDGGLRVGNQGEGTLTVHSGGRVEHTNGHALIGFHPGAQGEVLVTGSGSAWINDVGILWVGNRGHGSLSIDAGGFVSSQGAILGAEAGATGSVATVTGLGSLWDVQGVLRVGNHGSATLNIAGGGTVSNTGNAFLGLRAGQSGVVNLSGITSSWENQASLFVGGSAGAAGGTGILNISGGTVDVAGTLKTWATGSVNLSGGKLRASTFDRTVGSFTMTGGMLVAGTVIGSLVAGGGFVAPGDELAAGVTTITGNFTQQAGATLQIELGGTGLNQFDRLAIDGTATLGGTLDVSLLGPFSPVDGNTFVILTAAGGLGGTTFSNVNLPVLGGGLFMHVDYLPTSVVLHVDTNAPLVASLALSPVPEPVSAMLLLTAVAIIGVSQRHPRYRAADRQRV